MTALKLSLLSQASIYMSTVYLSSCSLGKPADNPVDPAIYIHGYEWAPNQPDDRVDYIGNPDLNDSKPIQSLMRPFERRFDGSDFAYLQDDVSIRMDGSPAHLTDPAYFQGVEVPEFYYIGGLNKVSGKQEVLFSAVRQPGWMRIRKHEIARYMTQITDGKVQCHSGLIPANNKNLIEFNTAAQATAEDMFVHWFASYNALALLLVHDIGRRNAQAVWGGLQGGSTYSKIPNGLTDALTTPSGEVSASATTAGNKPFRWRFIENFYGDSWKELLGVYTDTVDNIRSIYVCGDPYKSNTTSVITSDYKRVSSIGTASGWVLDINTPWITPKALGGSSTTGFGDYSYNNASNKTILLVGGHSGIGATDGPFYLISSISASTRHVNIGARLASIARLSDSERSEEDELIAV